MGTGKVIFIRADANEQIASGHIMRCLTIAGALRRQGHSVTFLVSDHDSESALTIRGETSFLCLESNYRCLEEELPMLLPLLSEKKPDVFLLDSYFASARYMEAVRKLCRLVYLDDLQQFSYPVDLVINYDLTADASFYSDTPALLGASYTPLREQFLSVPYSVKERVSTVLISTGGSDIYNAASRIFEVLAGSDYFTKCKATFHVLTGNMNSNKDSLYHLAEKNARMILHENVTEMAGLISSCDLAFSAGGTTLFELCAVGVPAVSFSISDVQHPCVHAFEKAGIIPYAGDVREGDAFYEKLLSMGIEIAENPTRRKELSAYMKQFVDGQGADRIARAITDL